MHETSDEFKLGTAGVRLYPRELKPHPVIPDPFQLAICPPFSYH